MEQIELRNISKQYHKTPILTNITQSFSCGYSYAFTGHNGCGKSTLLRLISGLTVPDAGKVAYSKKFRFSYVPEKFKPTPLSGRAFLTAMGALDGIEERKLKQRIEQLAESFYLSDMLDLPMKNMSKGTLQKIGVIQAILERPEVLLLDEPLSGQDRASQKAFAKEINDLRKAGTAVFISCHEKWIAKAAADEIFTIENCTLVPYREEKKRRYQLLLGKTKEAVLLPEINDKLKRWGEDYTVILEEDNVQRVLRELLNHGWILRGMYEDEQHGQISDTDLL